MNFELAKSTGFTIVSHPQDGYSEAMHKILSNPIEDTSKDAFSCTSRKDKRIKDLIKKASVAYTVDAMVRQGVDKFSELFKSFDFEGGDAQVKYIKDRMIQMTLQTGEHWETTLTRIVHEYFKTGNAFIAKRRGGNAITGKRALYKNKPYCISGLSLISADRLEINRNKNGEFIGWEITGTKNDDRVRLVLPTATRQSTDTALINNTKVADQPNVLIPGIDVVHVAYKKGADSHYGFGLTLAALEDISMTRTLEQITAIMMKKFSNPIIHHKILRPSSPLAGIQQEINMAYELYRKMAPDGVLITGGNAEIKAIGSESQALRVEGYLKYFLHRALAGLGISPYILGLEGGGQGTVEAAVELMMMRVRFCQAEIAREIEMFILNELLWEGGFDPYTKEEDIVKLTFDGVDEAQQTKMANTAADLFNKNLLDHNEARQMAKIRGKHNEKDLYLNKIEIPKSKADAIAKGDAQKTAGVAIARARPKPAAPKKKKKAKEVLEDISNFIPENNEQLDMFINVMEKKYDYDADILNELYEPLSRLFGDEEAIKLLLVERLSDD